MRLIDADALLQSTDKESVHAWEIALAPTVDAEPVRHGHWVEDATRIRDQCSVCGLSVNWSQYKTPYCPLCGAKMSEVGYETD